MMVSLLDRHPLHDHQRGGYTEGRYFGLPVVVQLADRVWERFGVSEQKEAHARKRPTGVRTIHTCHTTFV